MLLLLLACTARDAEDTAPPALPSPLTPAQVEAFDILRVKALIDELADDDHAGRTPGSLGHADALEWLEQELEAAGLEPAGDAGSYRQVFPMEVTGRYATDAEGNIVEIQATQGTNLAGLISGTERPEELIVVMAHYDHLGMTQEGEIFNGAYDDASGVGIILEIARLYREQAIQPERSILFLFTDGEESGLRGAGSWVESAPWDLSEVVAAFSVDPMGRPMLPDTWPMVLLGMERSPELMALWRHMARSWSEVPVHFVNRAAIPIFSSDQDPFWDAPQPMAAAWVTSPGFTWYHTVDDTPETIDYRTVQDHGRFLAQAVLAMANSEDRWTDLGEQQTTAADARDAVALMETVLASEVLTETERFKAIALQKDFQELANQGASMDSSEAAPVVTEAMFFIMLDLAQAHPGELPPPMP